MAFTRFHDDPCRIMKKNQQTVDQARWILDVPGNGDKPYYMNDPQIISQKWGGNLWTNSVDVQSSLLGIDRKPMRDCLGESTNPLAKVNSHPIQYPVTNELTTEQSRATNPAFLYRDLEQVDWYYLPLDPQENVFMPFRNNIDTRVLEKDYFNRKFDCQMIQNPGPYPTNPQLGSLVGGSTMCTSTNSCTKIQNL